MINNNIKSFINVVFRRVATVDPITRGLDIALNWFGINIIGDSQQFWSQNISLVLTGVMIFTSIRGLLKKFTEVNLKLKKNNSLYRFFQIIVQISLPVT